MADKTSNNPWLGLSSYKYEDASRFYGRDKELQDLANIIRQNIFTTIYGVSGAGKTSIINAGLFPILDKENYLPIYIRLNHEEGRTNYDEQIINAVENALTKAKAESELMAEAHIESELDKLWLYFHSHRFWTADNHKLVPILFIDQFEEIFTKNENVNDVWSFFNVIDSLQYNIPTERILAKIQEADQCITFGEEMNFRLVFTMREDFLPRLEDYCFDIPAMRRNRVGLKPLNGLQALEVITKPRPDIVSRKVALHIISKIIGNQVKDNQRRLEATSVDTSILSLFCTELYNYGKIDENGGSITISLVDLYGGNILEWFYDRNMQALPKKTYIYLENQLLTHSGFRNSAAMEDLLENGVTREQLDTLEENRIIRIEDVNYTRCVEDVDSTQRIEGVINTRRVEFTHDVLCKIAKKRKDERDSVERAKGEVSARKSFTFDSVFFLSIGFAFFMALYYVGFDSVAFVYPLILPLVLLFFMLFAHRHVADKNFSTMFWTLIGSIVFIAGFTYYSEKVLYNIESIQIKGTAYVGYIFVLPLLFLFSPMIINIHQSLSFAEKGKKINVLFFVIIFLLFCIESISLAYWITENNNSVLSIMRWATLLLYESPLCFLMLSPGIILYKNRKNLTAWNIATTLYSSYELIVILLFAIGVNYDWFPTIHEKEKTYVMPLFIISCCILVLYAFYGIQYMRQPKEHTLMTYCNNVLTFQSFKKYKTFGTRLKTIAIAFFVIYVWQTATSYYDIIPFISLPLCCILVLYAASKEIKLTTKKQVLTTKVWIPVVILAETIVALQYTEGYIKQGMIYIATTLLAIGTFALFAHKENLKGNKTLVAQLAAVALLVAGVLPSVCLGYNICNPSLTNISRVWRGRISSNIPGVNFLTIENSNGKKGVMDYSEIIIVPQYDSVKKLCYIDVVTYVSMHPIESWIKGGLFSIEAYDGINYTEKDDASYLRFLCDNADGTSYQYGDFSFLETINKYGRFITDYELSLLKLQIDNFCSLDGYESIGDTAVADTLYVDDEYSDAIAEAVDWTADEYEEAGNREISLVLKDFDYYNTVKALLNFDNLNITDSERRNLIANLVINLLFKFDTNPANAANLGFMTLLDECHKYQSLTPLLSYNGAGITSKMMINAALNIAPLLCYDKTGTLKSLVLDRLWDKYVKDNDVAYKLLCLMLADEREEALAKIDQMNQSSHESMSDMSILCIIDLYTNDKDAAYGLIDDYVQSMSYEENTAAQLFVRIANIHKLMVNLGNEEISYDEIEDISRRLHIHDRIIIVDSEMLNVPHTKGTYIVKVDCATDWYVRTRTAAPWIQLEEYDHYVKLEVSANYDIDPREDFFVLESDINSVCINIRQEGW